MLSNKIESRKLTTWRTKVCISFFPYGSSPWPPIATFVFTQLPSILLAVQLFLMGQRALAIYLIVLQFVIFVFMIKILTTNPGILPQIINKFETDVDLFEVPSKAVRHEHKYLLAQHSLLHPQKYCSECHIYRPIRSIHCSACNHCVQRYDHHCPWLAICIGKYNYKYFLGYLAGLLILIVSTLTVGIVFTVNISRRQESGVGDFVIYMLVGLVALIFLLPIGRLLFYHLHLIKMGLTTNQQIKKTYQLIDNKLPYPKLQYSIYREKRLPKFSFKRTKLRKPESVKYQPDVYEETNNPSLSKSMELPKQEITDRVSILNSLIQNEHL